MNAATRIPGVGAPPYLAGADLRGQVGRFLKRGAQPGTLVPITALGDVPVAVLQDGAVMGDACEVEVLGVAIVIAGDALPEGALVTHDAQGRAVPCAPGRPCLGRTEHAAGAGAEVSCLVDLVVPHAGGVQSVALEVPEAEVPAHGRVSVALAVAGLSPSALVVVEVPPALEAGLIYAGHAVASGTLTLIIANLTDAAITADPRAWSLKLV